MWPAPERVEKSLDRSMSEHPLLYLVRHVTVSVDGRSEPLPAADAERRDALLTGHFAQEAALRLGIHATVVDVLRARGLWSTERLADALRIADPGLAEAGRPALDRLDDERGWVAAHSLIPQVERAVRLVAMEADTTTMIRDPESGVLRNRTLGDLLADGGVSEALGPRLTFALERLLVRPWGPNYRNEIAHGMMQPDADLRQVALLGVLAVLSIGVRLLVLREQMGPGGDEPFA